MNSTTPASSAFGHDSRMNIRRPTAGGTMTNENAHGWPAAESWKILELIDAAVLTYRTSLSN
jgi:hypothetical protein